MNTRRIIPLINAAPTSSHGNGMAASAGTSAHPGSDTPPPTVQLDSPPPLALYVHYPWCIRKCPYCDFNSHHVHGRATGDQVDAVIEAAYIDALIADLETALPQVWGRRVQSVFIGGGTPSLMSAASLERLLTAIRMLLPLDPLAEITLEANPGTFEASRFRDYRAAGINRLSIGIQSFDDGHLVQLGRIHDAGQARRAIDIAQQYFERINLDLMYALPGQTLAQACQDLDIALDSGVSHLSCYHLTLEPNTPFHRNPPSLPDDDAAADMQETFEARLTGAGFQHYETSGFARAGQQCRHNLNYWTFGDYLGIGAGAHGKLSDHTGIAREMRHKHPNRYLEAARERHFIQARQAVEAVDLPFEFLMNALRLNDGFSQPLFQARTGLPLSFIEGRLIQARRRGLLDIAQGRIRPTPKGRRFLNDLLSMFLADD